MIQPNNQGQRANTIKRRVRPYNTHILPGLGLLLFSDLVETGFTAKFTHHRYRNIIYNP